MAERNDRQGLAENRPSRYQRRHQITRAYKIIAYLLFLAIASGSSRPAQSRAARTGPVLQVGGLMRLQVAPHKVVNAPEAQAGGLRRRGKALAPGHQQDRLDASEKPHFAGSSQCPGELPAVALVEPQFVIQKSVHTLHFMYGLARQKTDKLELRQRNRTFCPADSKTTVDNERTGLIQHLWSSPNWGMAPLRVEDDIDSLNSAEPPLARRQRAPTHQHHTCWRTAAAG